MRKRMVSGLYLQSPEGVDLPGDVFKFMFNIAAYSTRGYFDMPWDARTIMFRFWTLTEQNPELIKSWMDEVVRRGLVTPYEVEGVTYAYVTGWVNKDQDSPFFQKLDPTREGSPRVPVPKEDSETEVIKDSKPRKVSRHGEHAAVRSDEDSHRDSKQPRRRGIAKRPAPRSSEPERDSELDSVRSAPRKFRRFRRNRTSAPPAAHPDSPSQSVEVRKFRGGRLTRKGAERLLKEAKERSYTRSKRLGDRPPNRDTQETTKGPQNRSEGVSRPPRKKTPLPTTAPDPNSVPHISVPEAMKYVQAGLWTVEQYKDEWMTARGNWKFAPLNVGYSVSTPVISTKAKRTFRK